MAKQKKSVLGTLIANSPESIIAAAEAVEKEITGAPQVENTEVIVKNQPQTEEVTIDKPSVTAAEEAPVYDMDYFFKEITGKKIEYRPSLMSAEFLDRIKYLSIVFQVPMKDITYNICNYWWETHKVQIQKEVKKRKKDFI